ncbi:unnamed protein product [Cuscuta campestris]|uniref:Uncharacterized protein n=1 Tax=Cuscuta campestris TaxID=132261 RepID=A0A484M017_9ASTE|nr:unnamed protein product [Cuscuta campestris]
MPGNGVGDRVHNFFAQDTFSPGQHQPEVLDKNQPGLNNYLWAGNQGPNCVPSYTTKGFNLQQSVVDTGRGSNSHLANGPPGLNFTRFTSRPEIQLQSQQQSFNGYTYGNLYETRQDEGNFLAADSDKQNVASAGSFYEQSLQGVGLQHQAQMVNSGASLSSGNFGLFGGHQQMSRQQLNMLQPLQLQQSGLKDMHQLQQQVMFMRMQEFQRQQKLQQPDARQQNPQNQTFPLVNSNIHSRALGFSGAADNSNTNWLQGSSSALQVSSNGVPSSNHGQGHHMMGLTPQQIDQSLFGVPVSTLRTGGIPSSQYSQAVTDKLQMQQSASFSTSIPFQQYAQSPDQVGVQDATTVSRQRFISEKSVGHGPNQSLYNAINMENLQEVNAIQHREAIQEFQEREEAASPSMNPQEKALNKIRSPPNEVGLDPTEERILFGSDDNIWAAFGKSVNTGEEASNSLDASGLLNGFPSIQAGTWSALMQSAIAEAASTDLGPQEELSGLNFQSTVVPSRNQNVSMNNNGRQPSTLMDAHIPIASSMNHEASQPSDSDNMKSSSVNHPGFQQFGHKYINDISQKMQINSVHRLVQPSEENSKWPAVAPMQTSTSHVFDREVDSKMVSSSWIDELDRPSKTHDKINDWDALGSTVPTEDASARIHSSQNCSNSLGSSQNIGIHGDTVHTGAFWKVDPETHGAANFELTRYSPASGPVNSELLCSKGAETFVKHSSLSGTEESSRFLLNNSPNQVKHWKNANTSAKGKETLGFERSHFHNINDHNLNSLETTSQEDRTHEADIYNKPENSNDSYRSNVSHQNSAGSWRENVLLDSSDSRSLFTGKEKLSNNTGKKSSARKFHYHPMGNLDEYVGSPNALQKILCTQAMTSQTAHVVQSKLFIQGQSSNVLRDGQGLADVHTQSCFSSSVSNMSVPFTGSVDIPPQLTASPSSSPSMLQLLPKVDQSRVFGTTMPKAENSDGSVVRQYPSHSSAAQVFGLQLGPPSQFTPVHNNLLSSQSSMRTVCSSSPSQSVVEIGDKAYIASMSQVKSFLSSETAQVEFAIKSEVLRNGNNEYNQNEMTGEFHPPLSSGLPYSRSRVKNQLMELKSQSPSRSFKDTTCFTEEDDSHREPSCGLSAKKFSHEVASNIACPNLPNSLGMCKQASSIDSHETPERSVDNSLLASQLLSSSIMSQQASLAKTMDNTWNTSQENPCLHQSNVVGTFSATENRGDRDANTGGNSSTEVYANDLNPLGQLHREEEQMKERHQHVSLSSSDIVEKTNKAQEEHIINNPSDVYPVFSASMQRDIEAFGRSLKPNNFSHQNFSSPNQIQYMKNEEIEHSKALKGSRPSDDSSVCMQVKHVVVPSVDSRMPKFSEPGHMEINMTSQEVNAPTQEMHGIHMDDSRTISLRNNANSVKFKHTHVSPQMAPTWFNHFGSGTFKNGQVLHDAQKVSVTNMGEPPLVLDKSFSSLQMFKTKQQLVPANNDTGQDVKPSLHSIPAAAEQFCSSPSLSVGMGDPHSLLRPKKRKHISSHLSPWCDVVSQGSCNLQTISFAELVWAKVVNRVAEKVEEDVDLNENAPPRHRARRRLVLSTQLLQQVFPPPPKMILSANSYAEYEAVAYSVSRLVLGDACGMVSRSNDNPSMGADGTERISSKCKELEDNDHHLSKVIEEFTERARILEEEFLKLDRRLSLVDLVTENQDLEKFSVINRFAKFYGRGQADGAAAPSTSSDSATHLCNPFAQRYVTPLPMPRDLPTGVQCFSL